MTLQPAVIQQTQYRLAQHYLKKLQQANNAIIQSRSGTLSYWINTIQQDWLQIKQWRDWSVMPEQPDRARLCVDFCTTAYAAISTQQTTAETIAILQQGLQATRSLNDRANEAEILYMLGLNHLRVQQMAETRSCAEALMDCGEKLDNRMIGRAWYLLACVSTSSGDFTAAETQYTHSRKILEGSDPKEMVSVWAGFGHVAYFQGNYQASRDYHTKAMAEALLLNDEPNVAVAHLSLAGVCLQLKEVQQALYHAQQTLSIARQLSFLPLIPHSLTMLANVNRQLGRLDEARACYEEVLGITRATLSFDSVISALTGLGRVHVLQGDGDKAITYFVDALTMAQENGIVIRVPPLVEELVRIYLARGNISQARGYLDTLVASAQTLNTTRFYAKTVFVAATVRYHEGHAEQAAQWVGLLQQYAEHLNPNQVTQLSNAIRDALGEERYTQAIASGQSLVLDDVMRGLTDKP